jgi:hypothetical protein
VDHSQIDLTTRQVAAKSFVANSPLGGDALGVVLIGSEFEGNLAPDSVASVASVKQPGPDGVDRRLRPDHSQVQKPLFGINIVKQNNGKLSEDKRVNEWPPVSKSNAKSPLFQKGARIFVLLSPVYLISSKIVRRARVFVKIGWNQPPSFVLFELRICDAFKKAMPPWPTGIKPAAMAALLPAFHSCQLIGLLGRGKEKFALRLVVYIICYAISNDFHIYF